MKYQGSCHCGKVSFEFEGDIKDGVSCNCSICHRKGTVLTFVPATNFKILSGEDNLTNYQFGQKRIHHTFCSTCGVTAFSSGTTPNGDVMRAVNLRCVDGVDLGALQINEYDGKSL